MEILRTPEDGISGCQWLPSTIQIWEWYNHNVSIHKFNICKYTQCFFSLCLHLNLHCLKFQEIYILWYFSHSLGGFLSHRATPSSHPFRTMGFSRLQKPSSYGVPRGTMAMETPIGSPRSAILKAPWWALWWRLRIREPQRLARGASQIRTSFREICGFWSCFWLNHE